MILLYYLYSLHCSGVKYCTRCIQSYFTKTNFKQMQTILNEGTIARVYQRRAAYYFNQSSDSATSGEERPGPRV
jgi:hypothetical protein